MKSRYNFVVIDVSLDEKLYDRVREIVHSPVIREAKNVQLLHVIDKADNQYYPVDVDRNDPKAVDAYVEKALGELTNNLRESSDPEGKWNTTIIRNSDAKLTCVDFLKEVHADLVITATRGGTEGLHTDSFSSYLIANAPCDVYVVKH